MSHFDEIFENNRAWIANKLKADEKYFKKLAVGQRPEILYIGCSDSRVTIEELMGADPGEIFVHRNIANLVVAADSNLNAVVQFAVEFLHVKRIVVCGHYECGGVRASMERSDLGQLNSWLQGLRDVYRFHRKELDSMANQVERYDRLVELNVKEQCLNIVKIDHVQRMRSRTGFPTVHGWVFDVRTGLLKDLGLDMSAIFGEVKAIYDLSGEELNLKKKKEA